MLCLYKTKSRKEFFIQRFNEHSKYYFLRLFFKENQQTSLGGILWMAGMLYKYYWYINLAKNRNVRQGWLGNFEICKTSAMIYLNLLNIQSIMDTQSRNKIEGVFFNVKKCNRTQGKVYKLWKNTVPDIIMFNRFLRIFINPS